MSYFIFDDIASLAGSADAQNVDPDILNEAKVSRMKIHIAPISVFLVLRQEHVQKASPFIPRMVDQVQHFDVCLVVNNRQTGAMPLQVKLFFYILSFHM